MKKELGSLAAHRAYLGLPPKKGSRTPFPMAASRVFEKQVSGLCRRLEAIRCRDCVLGLSGGLDSTLALIVVFEAFDRLGFDKRGIHVYTMPGFGTSARTKGNAGLLCEGLGLELETIDIVKSCRQHFRDIGHDGKTPDVTFENVQARMRTLVLMNKANMTGGIVVGTGDFFLKDNRALHEILARNKVAHLHLEVRGSDDTRSSHTHPFRRAAAETVFRFLAGYFATGKGEF